MGQITAVSETAPGKGALPVVSSVTYKPFGPATGFTYGNGVVDAHSFDLDYRQTGLTDKGKNPVQNLTYGYYANNSLQTITDAVNAANSQSMGYDALDRLTSAQSGKGGYLPLLLSPYDPCVRGFSGAILRKV